MKKSIILSISYFGNPISDFYKKLGEELLKNSFIVIFIFDKKIENLPQNTENIFYYTYPSLRPTKLVDFIFLLKIIHKHKPHVLFSNFGSTNLMTLCGNLMGVKNIINFIHSSIVAITIDSKQGVFVKNYHFIRKKIIYHFNTHLFINSTMMRKDYIDFYKINPSKISVIPLLIKGNLLNVEENNRNKQLLIVGRLSKSKGHLQLIRQFRELLYEIPDIRLIIAGSGEQLEILLNEVKVLNIEKSVDFLGNVKNENINELYLKSLIHISSSFGEGFGLVNIESLRNSTPIISTRTAGARDILVEGENGEFFDHDIQNSLTLAVKKILSNWSYYSKNSKKYFIDNYDIENCIENTSKIIMNHFV